MSYIGRKPTVGNFQICDAISVVNNQAAYTMQVGSVNVLPETANHMIVSLNGVIQKPNSSYTVAGAVITFSSALVTGDVINFIQILGSVLDVGTVSDATITKVKTNFVSSSSGYTGTGLDIKGNGSANGRLGLLCSAGTHGVALESPDHSAGQSYTMKLPDNQIASDKFLKVKSISGSGNTAIGQLEFADAGLDGWSSNSGNLLPADASKGIYLGVNSATASNLLNDYEFGTWTPAITGSPTGSYSYQYGNYTKINKMVYITGFVQGNLSGGSGSAKISGLPFTPDSGSNVYYEPVSLGFTYGLGTTLYQAFFQADATEFFLLGEPSSGARTHVNTSDIVSSDMRISFSGFYNTAA